jgi:opacity protein-like surface antigen
LLRTGIRLVEEVLVPSVRIVSLCAAFALLIPGSVQAQTILSAFAGTSFKGDVIEPPRPFAGVTGIYWAAAPLGVEIEFTVYPEFFPARHPNGDLHVVGGLSTGLVNVILGAPFGGTSGPGFRPYISGGLAVFQIRADEPDLLFDTRGTDLGFNVGGGAIVFFSDRMGVHGALRYLRDRREDLVADVGHGRDTAPVAFRKFDLLRASIGVALRF